MLRTETNLLMKHAVANVGLAMNKRTRFATSRQHLTHRFISAEATYGHNALTKRPAFYFDCSVLSRARVVSLKMSVNNPLFVH